jgi:hypothetical protein
MKTKIFKSIKVSYEPECTATAYFSKEKIREKKSVFGTKLNL